MLDIPRALVAQGAQVTVLQSCDASYLHHEDNLNLLFVKESGPRVKVSGGLFPPINIVRSVQDSQPDIIHVHGLHHASQLSYLSRIIPKTPIVVQDHANKVAANKLRRRYHAFSLKAASAVTFTSLELAHPFIESGVLSSETPLYAVSEGSTAFGPGPLEDARRSAGIDGNPCCLWVGDLKENKDPLTVLRGFRLVLDKLPKARLWMCFRQSPLLSEVEAYINESFELRGKVHLLGAQEHARLEMFYRACDFYVSASHREGGAYSAIEALACGARPIVTDIPVFRSITDHGKQGGLFAQKSPEQFCETLLQWHARISKEDRLKAREHFEKVFSLEVVARDLLRVYQAVLSA